MAGAVFRAVQKACDAVLQRQQLEGAIATGKAARLKEGAVKPELLSESVLREISCPGYFDQPWPGVLQVILLW